MIFTASFWKGALERAIKTFCQTLLAVVGVSAVGDSAGITDVSWPQVLSVAALATLLSVITSIGNAGFTAGVPEISPAAAAELAAAAPVQEVVPVEDTEPDVEPYEGEVSYDAEPGQRYADEPDAAR